MGAAASSAPLSATRKTGAITGIGGRSPASAAVTANLCPSCAAALGLDKSAMIQAKITRVDAGVSGEGAVVVAIQRSQQSGARSVRASRRAAASGRGAARTAATSTSTSATGTASSGATSSGAKPAPTRR
jgi:hypothetical protein